MSRLGTWLRRILRWTRNGLLLLLAGLTIAVLSQSLWLPSLIGKTAADKGFDVTYEDLDLWPLGGALRLTGLEVRALPSEDITQEDQPLLLDLDYLHADSDISALFRGNLRVHRIEVDGLRVWAQRDSKRAWNWEQVLDKLSAASESQEPAPSPKPDEQAEEAQEWDLRSPLRIDALRLQNVELHLQDAVAQPTLDTVIRMHLGLSLIHISEPTRPY